MKLSKSRLQQIIKEEIRAILEQKPKTGTLSPRNVPGFQGSPEHRSARKACLADPNCSHIQMIAKEDAAAKAWMRQNPSKVPDWFSKKLAPKYQQQVGKRGVTRLSTGGATASDFPGTFGKGTKEPAIPPQAGAEIPKTKKGPPIGAGQLDSEGNPDPKRPALVEPGKTKKKKRSRARCTDNLDDAIQGFGYIRRGCKDEPDGTNIISLIQSKVLGMPPCEGAAKGELCADGVYGRGTAKAVRAWQKQEFPDEPDQWDGIIGTDTAQQIGRKLGRKQQQSIDVRGTAPGHSGLAGGGAYSSNIQRLAPGEADWPGGSRATTYDKEKMRRIKKGRRKRKATVTSGD